MLSCVNIRVNIWVDFRFNSRVGGKENPETKHGKTVTERIAFSRSPGRETLAPKFSARTYLKNHIFGQIGNYKTFYYY